MKVLLILFPCLFAINLWADQPLAWQQLTLNDGQLTVQLPNKPTKTQQSTSSLVGEVNSTIYVVKVADEGSVTIDCSSLPGTALFFAGADTIYDNAKGKLMSQVSGKTQTWEPVTLDGISGKKLTYTTPPANGKAGYDGTAEFYLVGDTLYIIDVMDVVGKDLGLRSKVFGSLDFPKKD